MYLTMNINAVDDCLSKVYKQNISFFYDNISVDCIINSQSYNNPIINKSLYEYEDVIIVNVSDKGVGEGYINVDVILNEYIIRNKHRKFWKCINCEGDNSDYIYNNITGNFDFFKKSPGNPDFYIFNFQINSSFDLNYFENEVNSSFYELKSQKKTLNFSSYDINKEIELIKLNLPNNFYIKDNPNNITINYENYFFKIYFNQNSFKGKLIGLNISNYSDIELSNGSNFTVSISKGLRYILSDEEKRDKNAHLYFEIEGYNSPFNTSLSKLIAQKTDYNFNLSIYPNSSICLNEIYPYYYYNNSIGKYYECLNLTKKEIINNMSKIINDVEIGQSYEIQGIDIIINIFQLNSTFLSLSSNTNFIFCENIIRDYYNLSSSITFIKFQTTNENKNSFLNKIEYQAYYKKEILNLSICNNKNINMSINESNEFPMLFQISPIIIPPESKQIYDQTKTFYSIINKTKEELIKNISVLIENIIIGQNYEIKGEDFIVKISPTNTTHLSNSTHVNFTKCENILRAHYNISASRYITFMQLEINNINSKVLINKVEYQAYDDNNKLLNLSICNENIKIIHSIKSSSLFDFLSANSFKDLGIDIFNINDSFFTDVCHSYSDSKNDLTLRDRIKDIFQNYSLCEEECSYDEINFENMTITCDCKVKNNLNVSEITENLIKYEDKNRNFQIIKCYNLVFSLKDKLSNIGFWIFLFLVTAHIPLLFLYFYHGIKPIKKYIFNEMIKFGYIKKSKETDSLNKRSLNKNNNKKNKKHKNIKINIPPKKKYINTENVEDSGNQFINSSNLGIKKNKKNINNFDKNKKTNKDLTNILLIKKSNKEKTKNINVLITQEKREKDNKDKIKDKKSKNNKKNIFNFNIININLNKNERNYIPQNSNQILNNYIFEEAIKYDLRSICLIYYIILLSKQAIFHAFLFKSPLEVFSLRLCLLFFIYSSDLALNAFFYLDDKISEKYHYTRGLFLFAFSNNITVIILSTLVGFLFMTLFTNLSNSTNKIRNVFRNEENKLIKNKKYNVSEKRKKEIKNEINKILKIFKIKTTILIIIEFLLMLFFWYYVTAFCHVYNSTQMSWLLDSFLSILSRTVIDFLFPLLLAKIYRIAVESNVRCLYNIILFFYSFG